MEGKVCTKCKQWKPLEEFHKNKSSKDGRKSQCKECRNKTSRRTGVEIKEGMKKCTQCKQWKSLDEFNKNKNHKDGRQYECRECQKKYKKRWDENNKEHTEEYQKQWRGNNPGYHNSEQQKQHREVNKGKKREYDKQYRKDKAEHIKEQMKQYYQSNKEHCKEQGRQYYQSNKEHCKEQGRQRYQNNKEHIKEQKKQYYQNNKQNNLQYISSIVEQINPVFKQLNLPIYGYVYMFENVKTGHKYVGQSTLQLKIRYNGSNIVQGWIKERLEKDTQKFKSELIEEDFIVTETLDVAFCQYHLDKLEAYYIDKYDSFLNGYNNNAGHYNTDDGIEEFNRILLENNLQFIDGKLIRMKEVV